MSGLNDARWADSVVSMGQVCRASENACEQELRVSVGKNVPTRDISRRGFKNTYLPLNHCGERVLQSRSCQQDDQGITSNLKHVHGFTLPRVILHTDRHSWGVCCVQEWGSLFK